MIVRTGLVYRNSRGDEFDFDARGVYARPDPIMDWAYDASEMNGHISRYTRGSSDIEFEVDMTDPGLLRSQMDALYSVAAYDIARDATGTLVQGEWSIPAALVSSSKTGWWLPDGPARYTLKFHSASPWWERASTREFLPASRSEGGLDYPFDYDFDYGIAYGSESLHVGGDYPADFLLRVYGPASDPNVIIDGNSYTVAVEIPAGGLLEVDTKAGTVVLRDSSGVEVNAFPDAPGDGAGSGRYILEQLKPGDLPVTWDGGFGFDLTVYEKRDERTWSDWT